MKMARAAALILLTLSPLAMHFAHSMHSLMPVVALIIAIFLVMTIV
jgi:hypothetical protein